MMKTSDAAKDSGNNRHAIVQTTLRVTETETDVQVVSDRGIQTVTSTLPSTDNQAVIPFLEFTPYSEIEKDSQRVVDLPRKALLQFDLERKVPKRSNSELNPKGVLKKSSSVVEFDSEEQIVPGVQLNNKMSKSQEEQEIQTDLTVNPYILDEDSVAYVCTQLATQTSLTFDPADSLSQITSALKKVLRHTKNFQAVVIDGKLVTDYVDPSADEESKQSRESIDEGGSHNEETPREDGEAFDVHSKDIVVSTKPSTKSTQKTDAIPGAPLQMTEEEFEANVQKILDKTVKNVYEFMAKIVEMYELSKEEGKLPPDALFKTPVDFETEDTGKTPTSPKRSFPPVPEEDEEEEIEKQQVAEGPVVKAAAESLQMATGLIRGPKWILQNTLKIDVNTGLPLPTAEAHETDVIQAVEEGEGAIEFILIDSKEAEEHFSQKQTPGKSNEPESGRLDTPPPSLTLINKPLQASTLTKDTPSTAEEKTTNAEEVVETISPEKVATAAEDTVPPEEVATAAEDTVPPEDAPIAAKTSVPVTASIITPLEDLSSPGVSELTKGRILLVKEKPEEGIISAEVAETEITETSEIAEVTEGEDDTKTAETAEELEDVKAVETAEEVKAAAVEELIEETDSPSSRKVIKEKITPGNGYPEEDTTEPSERPPGRTPPEDIGDSRTKPAADDIVCECSRIHEAGAAPPALYQPCGPQETSIKFEVIVLNDGGIKQCATEGVVVQASVTRPEQSDRPDRSRDVINVSVTVGGQKIKSPSAPLTIEDAESQVFEEAIKDDELQALEECSCDEEVTETQQSVEAESVTGQVNPTTEFAELEYIRIEPDPTPLAETNRSAEPIEPNVPQIEPEEMEPTETEAEPTETEPLEVKVEPEQTEPIEPEEAEPLEMEIEPEQAEPIEPEEAEAIEPEEAEAIVPEEAEPTETKPSLMDIEPEQTEPTEPEEVELTDTEATNKKPINTELTDLKPIDTEVTDAKPIEARPTPPAETSPPAEPKQERSTQLKKPISKPSVSINVTASFAEGAYTATAVQVSEMETQPIQKVKSKSSAGLAKQSKVTVIVPIQSKSSKVEAKKSSGDHAAVPDCSCRKKVSICPIDSTKQSEKEIRPPTDYLEQKEVPPKQSEGSLGCNCEDSKEPTPPPRSPRSPAALPVQPSRPSASGCDCQEAITLKSSASVCHCHTPITSKPSAPVCSCRRTITPEPSTHVCSCQETITPKPSPLVCPCHKSITSKPFAQQPITPKFSVSVCPCQRSINHKVSVPVRPSEQPITPISSALVCPCQRPITTKYPAPVCPCQQPITTKSSTHVCSCRKLKTPKSSVPTYSYEQPALSEIKSLSKSFLPCGCTQPKETPKQEGRKQVDAQVCVCDTTSRAIGTEKQPVDKIRSAPVLRKKQVCLNKEVQNIYANKAKDVEQQEESRRMWPYDPPPKKIHQQFSLPSQNVCPCDQPQEAQTRKDECVCGPVSGISQRYKQSIESYIQKLINDSLNARDPGLIQTHIACVGPYLQQIASNLAEEGISGKPLKCTGDASQQCACSVEVLFVNNDPERKDQGCTCSLPREKKPQPQEIRQPPPAAVKSCNCDLENEPTPNLECMYEQDDDYYEMYMEDLESGDFYRIEPTESEKEIAVCCQSQLPPDIVETNRCGSKIEIPWLSIALPPPGTIQIIPTREPKVICECWKLDLKDSVLSVTEVQQNIQVTGERCICNDPDKPQEQEIEIPSPKPEVERPEAEKRQVESLSDDDSSSKCNCSEIELDECENLELTSMNFVYDNPCFAQYEPYMDSIYKHFPDDCDTYCGPFTEIHWSEILLPKKVLLRETKRKQEPRSDFRTGKIGKDNTSVLPKFPRVENVESNATSEIEIELSFAQIASTLMKVEGGAASQQTVSEVSAISDVRMQIKRCPKDYVVTVVADGRPTLPEGGHFPTVGSLPFCVDAGGGGLVVTITPSAGHIPANPPTDINTNRLSRTKPAGVPPKAVTPTGVPPKSVSLPNLSTATLTSLDFHERYPRAMGRPFVEDYTEEKVVTVQDFEGAMYTCLPCQNVIQDDEFPRNYREGGFPKSKETPTQKLPPKPPRQEQNKVTLQPPTPVDPNISVDTVKSKEFRAKYNLSPPTYEDPECAGLYTIAMPEMGQRLFGIETMVIQNRKMTTKRSTSPPGIFQPQDKRGYGASLKGKSTPAQKEIGVCGKKILKPDVSSGPCTSTCKLLADQISGGQTCHAAGRPVARDTAINVQEITQKEMLPINQQIDDIKAKLRDMNIPELDSWNRLYYSDPVPGGIPSSIPPCPFSSQYSQLPPQMLYSGPSQFGVPQSQPPYVQAPYMPSLYPPDYFRDQYGYTPDYSMYGSLPSYSYYPYSDSETTEDPLDYVCHCTRRRSSARRKKKRKPPISSSECSCLSTSVSTPSRGTTSAKDIPCSRQSDRNASQVTFSISNQTKIDASNYSDYTQTESEPEVEIRVGKGPPKIKTKSCFKGFISEDPKSKCKFHVAVKVKPSKLVLSPKKEESDESSSYGHTT